MDLDAKTGFSAPTGRDSAAPFPKFLCDEMLGRLARYLRAAGFDTRLARDGAPDAQLLRLAAAEGRLLLTRDRQILEHKAARERVLLLPRGDLDRHAAALGDHLGLDWLALSFTRCLLDNTPLAPASANQRAGIPPRSRDDGQRVSFCPECGRVYWPGSHSRRMHATLSRWQAGAAAGRG